MNQAADESMNDELREWLQDKKSGIQTIKKTQDLSKAKLKGMCELCGERKSQSVCLKCGKSVCSSCNFKLISVCKKCVPQDIGGKWDGSRTDWEKKLGLQWVD